MIVFTLLVACWVVLFSFEVRNINKSVRSHIRTEVQGLSDEQLYTLPVAPLVTDTCAKLKPVMLSDYGEQSSLLTRVGEIV